MTMSMVAAENKPTELSRNFPQWTSGAFPICLDIITKWIMTNTRASPNRLASSANVSTTSLGPVGLTPMLSISLYMVIGCRRVISGKYI